ncbi:hypothetical protein [Faucicola boevrei]|uniref:hypothetical protein n=1 Tax=Faucicola boevrei TaxID=346665 RepID=UPI000372B166|nr:hypothetical protein [Moraxella boevrei]
MGLNQEISHDIANAFDTDLADVVTAFTAIRRIKTDDDWLENGNNHSETTYQGRGVFGNFHQSEIDGQSILITDIKLICLQKEINDTPAIDDIVNGYQVVAVQKDPANVSFTVQLRKV